MYWTMTGLSSPRSLFIFSTTSFGALSPTIPAAGSPGTAFIRKKVTIVTPRRVGMKRRRRFRMYAVMGLSYLVILPCPEPHPKLFFSNLPASLHRNTRKGHNRCLDFRDIPFCLFDKCLYSLVRYLPLRRAAYLYVPFGVFGIEAYRY